MRDFKTIIEVLKNYISEDQEQKVLDKEVAELLGINQSMFATIKRRNTTPYEKILEFSQREELCANELFFESKQH